jgi:4-alpha-glucanotransferase
MKMEKRQSGILLPVFSLWGEDGIGNFGKNALEFLDILEENFQSYWQILPLHPTGYGDSPYQSFSSFALNPYFLDPADLKEKGLLTKNEWKDYRSCFHPGPIQYGTLYQKFFPFIKSALGRMKPEDQGFVQYEKREGYWLEDYALFMAIKEDLGMIPLWQWPLNVRHPNTQSLDWQREKLFEPILFWKKLQYLLDGQWHQILKESENRGIRILGDMPLYGAHDSADFWAHPELFQVGEDGNPNRVAGCPPDDFCLLGQKWGNPLYRWTYHRETGYQWWLHRMGRLQQLYHGVRWDHFRGLSGYYAIPKQENRAEKGRWEKGPGLHFLKQIVKTFPDFFMVAENLGFLTKDVEVLLKQVGWPGMAVYQFAFDSSKNNPYLPHRYPENLVAYTGTHDNDTLVGWVSSLDKTTLKRVLTYAGAGDEQELPLKMMEGIMKSPAGLAIIPLQDWLGMNGSARINTPGLAQGNWSFRLQKEQLLKERLQIMKDLTEETGRRRESA